MPNPNAPLLLKTLAYIETHPEEWDQTVWFCGSAACFAGHAVLLDGGKVSNDRWLLPREDDPPADRWDARDGEVYVELRARRILGLTEEQAERLFASYNTLDELRAQVFRLVGDIDKLSELIERLAVAAAEDEDVILPHFADSALSYDDALDLWDVLVEAVAAWRNAEEADKAERRKAVEAAKLALIGGAR